jgi:hypothetical protein
MKIFVSYSSDTVCGVSAKDSERIDCYTLEADSIDDKVVSKGVWSELRDEEGRQIWEENDFSKDRILRPAKGFIISGTQRVAFVKQPSLWSVKEILEEKYKKRKLLLDSKHVLFQEFVSFEGVLFDGNLNFGKRFCSGQGVLINDLETPCKDFVLELECNRIPKMFISPDESSWTKIDDVKFSHRFKKETDKIYLKLDDYENSLHGYALYY